MKKLLLTSLLLTSFNCFAECTSCNGEDVANCTSNKCYCTDPGLKFNDCISKEKFCTAFGNIGASD